MSIIDLGNDIGRIKMKFANQKAQFGEQILPRNSSWLTRAASSDAAFLVWV